MVEQVNIDHIADDLSRAYQDGYNAGYADGKTAADVRPKWKSVREFTPEPGRYLTCCKSMVLGTDYYLRILSYTDNLESVDEYDFEGERIPGWFEYDSEYGHYSCDNVEWFMPLPEPPKEGET